LRRPIIGYCTHKQQMARQHLFAGFVALLSLVCDASVSDAQEEHCADTTVKQQLVQARIRLHSGDKETEDTALPKLEKIGLNPKKGKLQICQGDCDKDDDCPGSMQCFQRDGYTIPPGCDSQDVGEEKWDYCYNPEALKFPALKDFGASPDTLKKGKKLQMCEGDCDSDDDCEGGTTCYQRSGTPTVPGCSGEGKKDYDYCHQYRIYELSDKGVNPKDKLGQCEGDCDKDDDCEGNLKCHQRDGITSVPGCVGTGGKDWDYCTHENFGKINSKKR